MILSLKLQGVWGMKGGKWLESVILEVSSNLNDSKILSHPPFHLEDHNTKSDYRRCKLFSLIDRSSQGICHAQSNFN